jgi:ABC-type multidrug transport system ATPase subunit
MGGELSPQRGWVEIGGRRRRRSEEEEFAIRRMAIYLPDQPWLPAHKAGREFLLAVGKLYCVPDEEKFERTDHLLKLFDLFEIADKPVTSFSAGQRKKLSLCAALLPAVPVLLLDEPFSGGLDPAGLLALKRVLQHRVAEDGNTIVLSSPVPEIVEEIAGRVVILRDGVVAAFDTIEGLRQRTGVHGSFGAILERMLYPDVARNLESYLGKRQGA